MNPPPLFHRRTGAPACTTKLFRQWRASGGTFAHGQKPPPPGARAYVSWRTRLSLSRWQRAASVKWAQAARVLAGGVPWDEPWHMWDVTSPQPQPRQPEAPRGLHNEHHHYDQHYKNNGSTENASSGEIDETAQLREMGGDEEDHEGGWCASKGREKTGMIMEGQHWRALATLGAAVALASLMA